MKKNTKKVKAWAVVYRGGLCQNVSEIISYFIHEKKSEALDAITAISADWKIVPCTITYSLPKKLKKTL